jgi:hypothetical protein
VPKVGTGATKMKKNHLFMALLGATMVSGCTSFPPFVLPATTIETFENGNQFTDDSFFYQFLEKGLLLCK